MSNHQVEPASKPQALTKEAIKALRHEQVQGMSRRELLRGSLAVVAFAWGDPTLGASGAVLGLAGGIGAVLWSRGVDLKQSSLGGIILLNLGLPLLVPLISLWGHFGGIAGGFLVGSILGFGERSQGAAAASGAAVSVLVALGVSILYQTRALPIARWLFGAYAGGAAVIALTQALRGGV